MKKNLLALAALAEAGTGVILLAYPPIVVRLLFAEEVSGAGMTMSRLAGICLVGLGVACWPGSDILRAFYGMTTNSMLAMLYLIVIGHPWRNGWSAVVAGSCGPCDPRRASRRCAIQRSKTSAA